MDVETFFDRHAELYDPYYEDQDIGDVDFYVDRAKAVDGPVLEVGCGTGRIYLELLRAGVDADGIDLSAGMLEELERKANEDELDPSVRQADMTDFEPRREYAAIFVPFRAFAHNVTVADQLAALEQFREALAPGGELVLNTFVPDYEVIAETYGEVDTETYELDGEQYRVETISTLDDPVEMISRLARTVYGPDDEVVAESEAPIALITKREFEHLFARTGYSEYEVHGDFELDDLTDADQEMVWIARP